jgi:hypothetical protein
LLSCSTEENFGDAGAGVAEGANSEPVLEPSQEAPVATLSVSASKIKLGDEITLSWDSVNADSCDATGDWKGKLGTKGSEKIKPNKNKTNYTLTCSSADGTTSDSVTVSVTADSPTVPLPVLTCLHLFRAWNRGNQRH